MDRQLAVQLPPSLISGANCSVGARLQIPLQVHAKGIDRCTIRVTSEQNVTLPVAREVQLSENEENQFVVEVIARKASKTQSWVTVAFEIEGAAIQIVGFFLLVSP